MSWNIQASVEQAEHDNIVLPMELLRAARGITTTAHVMVGDRIDFSGLQARVLSVTHTHIPPNSTRAPNSVAHMKFLQPLFDKEIEILKQHGFRVL